MVIPIELIALALTANFGVFSLIAHFQFAMYRKVSDVATQHTTETAISKERISANERHLARNDRELGMMRAHIPQMSNVRVGTLSRAGD